jgi:hypothetical protein
MFKKILFWGLIAGLVAGGALSAITVFLAGEQMLSYGMVIGYTTMLIALSAVFLGIKRHRDEALGGVIRFWPAFGMGLGISVVAGIVYVIAWEATQVWAGIDFATDYAKFLIEERKAAGASAAELAKFAAEMDDFKVMYANPLYRLPMTFSEIFPVGVLVSLVSAALLRNPRFMGVVRE